MSWITDRPTNAECFLPQGLPMFEMSRCGKRAVIIRPNKYGKTSYECWREDHGVHMKPIQVQVGITRSVDQACRYLKDGIALLEPTPQALNLSLKTHMA